MGELVIDQMSIKEQVSFEKMKPVMEQMRVEAVNILEIICGNN